MDNDDFKPGKPKEDPEATAARDGFQFEKEEKERQARLNRQQFLQDQSLREGFRFLIKSIVQFIFFVSAGAVLVLAGQKLQRTAWAEGTVVILVGAGLIVKGMLSFAGVRSK